MENERATAIQVGGETYELLLTTKATKEIAGRYGGLENLGSKLMKAENFELALDEIVWLITLMANQSLLIHNLRHPEDKRTLLTPEAVELLTSPLELAACKDGRNHGGHVPWHKAPHRKRGGLKKRTGRVSDEELFTRLLYYATVQMGRSEQEAWLMPIGHLMDLWECHKQFLGLARPKRELFIDDIIPAGI